MAKVATRKKAAVRVAVDAKAAAFVQSIRDLVAQMPMLGVEVPALGGRFGGIAYDDGKPVHIVVLGPMYDGETDFKAMNAWASGLTHNGFKDWSLPNRLDFRVPWANLRHVFQRGYYWTCEPDADGSSFAWYQSFNTGDQYYLPQVSKLSGCAVRRVPI